MSQLRLPGLVDAHVHLREPGYTHKEDLYTGTVAALAGGVTTVLDMPNTDPPTATPEHFRAKARLAAAKAVCDVGLFAGATNSIPIRNLEDGYLPMAQEACGLKIYVNETFGNLRIDELGQMHDLFRTWAEKAAQTGYRSRGQSTGIGPIAVHAEDLMVPVCLNLSHLYEVPLHIVHVSRRSEIELIRRAKERGIPVTCEVTPHHLFLTAEDVTRLVSLGDMRPRLATPDDVAALWENLDVIDIFATDHAPHTLEEKGFVDGHNPQESGVIPETSPPGVPGVETMLPMLLTAVHEDRLTVNDIVERCVHAPRRIYGLPDQPETFIDVDVDAQYELCHENQRTKAGWTPFVDRTVYGRIDRVTLRGRVVFDEGRLLAEPGDGEVLFYKEDHV